MKETASAAARRLARVRASFSELEVDAILVGHPPNVRYLTGFSGSSGLLLLSAAEAIFATDGRYEQQAAEELADDAGFELLVSSDGTLDELAERAGRDFSSSRVGFERRYLSYADWERLREVAGAVEWVAASDAVATLRAVKEEEEIAAMRKAAEIAADALRQTLGLIELGMREVDIASELDYRIGRLAAERPAFETIVASGERTALPHARTSERAIRERDLLLFDFGARWRGYCCDLTRTFVVGEPTRRQTELYETVLAAQRAASDKLTAGAVGADVDRAAREIFESMDLEGQFPHGTGHGLGLEVHEAPRLHRRSEEELKTNMVVTVEPGLYFPGWGGVRLEDDLVVTRGKPRSLVDLSKERLAGLPL